MFERSFVRKYVKALKLEIEFYGKVLKDAELRVVDIHAGGGLQAYWTLRTFMR